MTEDSEREELVEQVLQLSEKTLRELAPLMSKRWLQLDLTMPQLKVVYILFMNDSARMGYIASELGVSLATATGVIDRLVEQDIVVRRNQPGDRRVVLCSLSEKGQELMSRMWRLYKDQHRDMLRELDICQLQILSDAIELVLQTQLTMKSKLQRRQSVTSESRAETS